MVNLFLANKTCEVMCRNYEECFEIWDYSSVGCNNGYCMCHDEDHVREELCKLPLGEKNFFDFMKCKNLLGIFIILRQRTLL